MIANLSTSLAHFKAAQAYIGEIYNHAIFIGMIQGLEDRYEFIKGEFYMSNVAYSRVINEGLADVTLRNGRRKYWLTPDAVADKHGQACPWMINGKFRIVQQWALTRIMMRIVGGRDDFFVFINRKKSDARNAVNQYLLDTGIHVQKNWAAGLQKLREELTDNKAIAEYNALIAAVEANPDMEHPWDGRIVIIRDDDLHIIDDVDDFADLNATKTTHKISTRSGINLMMEGDTHHHAKMKSTSRSLKFFAKM